MNTLALLLALALQQPQTIRVNYVNADLGDVIRSLATVLGVNVVLTDVPSRRITFQTPEPVPAPQVGAVLEAILESQGLVIVQTGPVAQVMPEEKRPTTGPVRVGKELPTPPPLGLVTQIVPLDYIRAEEGITLLKQVASKTARVEIVSRSNAVLITDRGVHIARYLDLLRQLDVKTGAKQGSAPTSTRSSMRAPRSSPRRWGRCSAPRSRRRRRGRGSRRSRSAASPARSAPCANERRSRCSSACRRRSLRRPASPPRPSRACRRVPRPGGLAWSAAPPSSPTRPPMRS